MNNALAAIIPLTLMAQELHEKMPSMPLPKDIPEKSPPPPWETAIYDIPKSIRKGKTWEEIREIKKQIWIEQQLSGKCVCLKCGKTKDMEDDTDTTEYLLTPKGVFCKNCIEAQEEKVS
jgi:hypothetical protein